MTRTNRHPEGDPVPGEGDPVATGPKGGGEWPSPSAPPDPAAPGSDPARAREIKRSREDNVGEHDEPPQ